MSHKILLVCELLIGILLCIVFAFSAIKVAHRLLADRAEQQAFKELSDMEKEYDDNIDVPSGGSQDNGRDLFYNSLYEMNPDYYGWLRVDGAGIDYPVMYSPDRPEFYLKHAFDGTKSHSGVPFIDSNCTPSGNYYLIYGHNMRNKTMFGNLTKYADVDYYKQNQDIQFDVQNEHREYRIIAAFYSRVYDEKENGVFKYYEYTDLSDEEVFNEYIMQLKAATIYDVAIDVEYGDELLALSTCSYQVDDGRFVVVASRTR